MLSELILSESFHTMLLGMALALLALYVKSHKTQLPPTPGLALPVLGHLYRLEKNPRKQFLEWGKKFGPLVSLYMGNQLAIVIYGYDAIKEAFVKNADVFSDRPKTFLTQMLGKDRGFVTSGTHWREQRKVTIEILRELGLGSNVMEEKVQTEVTLLVKAIDDLHGEPFDPRPVTMLSISNIIAALMFGTDFRHSDSKMAACARLIGDQISLIESAAVLNFLPFLRHLPGDIFGFYKVLNLAESLEQGLIKEQIGIHKANNQTSHDFVSGYLNKMAEQTDGVNSDINEENLTAVVSNLFAAGTETTSTTLTWSLLYLLHHPEVTERCYSEIVTHIGKDRRATFNDRHKARYIVATVMEIQRFASIAPFSLQHTASRDIMFRDYVIPKGTIIMPCLDSVHFSEEIWGDPHNFRPDRFLDDSGQVIKREELIPFSIGQYSCFVYDKRRSN
ncbi:unnamed protein product [Lymnaea stagnalis]|uniref:Uncharacterized protein n=1 Tax=Lymnaea stagnalis TaxID=6523 RepID=A0AAV2HPI4_LYMST